MKTKKMIEKTDGNGNTFLIPNPDLFNENGHRIKQRNPTNITPKKKKRKK